MAGITETTWVAAPPAAVFALATDLAGLPERVTGISQIDLLTPGPVGCGTRFRETRLMFGRPASEEWEIVDFAPGVAFTMRSESCGGRFESVHRFEPDGDGTRVAVACAYQPRSVMARLMAPLGKLMQGSMRKCIAQDLADLKAAAERVAPAPVAVG